MKNMKLKLTVLAAFAVAMAVCYKLVAGIYILVGTGVTISPNAVSNFNTPLVQVGTFTLTPQSVYLTHNGITNTNLVFITNRLTFDGTNFFVLPQVYQFGTTNPVANTLKTVTNITLPVYGALSVSNGQGQAITNFQAGLQY